MNGVMARLEEIDHECMVVAQYETGYSEALPAAKALVLRALAEILQGQIRDARRTLEVATVVMEHIG